MICFFIRTLTIYKLSNNHQNLEIMNKAKIRILVVDDSQENLNRARLDFANKNVVLICCSTFSVAADLLSLKAEGVAPFDIVLTDLMMPGEARGVYKDSPEIGKEVPYGLVLAILAKNKSVPHVAIMTNVNHHSGPIPWAMDRILGESQEINAFYGKNYFSAASKFMKIVDIPVDEARSQKSKIIISGVNNVLPNILALRFENEEVLVISSSNLNLLPAIFLSEEPQVVVLIGEIVNPNDQFDDNRYVGHIFEQLTALKKPEQRIIACGWHPIEDQVDYLQLPFTPDGLYNYVNELGVDVE